MSAVAESLKRNVKNTVNTNEFVLDAFYVNGSWYPTVKPQTAISMCRAEMGQSGQHFRVSPLPGGGIRWESGCAGSRWWREAGLHQGKRPAEIRPLSMCHQPRALSPAGLGIPASMSCGDHSPAGWPSLSVTTYPQVRESSSFEVVADFILRSFNKSPLLSSAPE